MGRAQCVIVGAQCVIKTFRAGNTIPVTAPQEPDPNPGLPEPSPPRRWRARVTQ